MNILSVHRMGDPTRHRSAVHELEYMMPLHASEHNHIVHDACLPLPEFIKEIDFHAIVLGPTFLCSRYTSEHSDILKNYDFIRKSNAFKIALPQDDYAFSKILDEWMVDWNINLLYTVCPEYWDVLYPEYIKKGKIKLGFTGYISDRMIEQWSNPKPFTERSIDVSYRASAANRFLGRVGNVKYEIAQRFINSTQNSGLKLDISVAPEDTIYGSKWHDFVENSKFCLATNSGSSLLDPVGEYRYRIKKYLETYPNATFTEVCQNCMAEQDGKYVFTAISPRNIEAALAETVQIAVPGTYNNILKPMEHYIPLYEDCSNIDDVLKAMRDVELVNRIRENCKEVILNTSSLRYTNHVGNIIDEIYQYIEKNNITGTSQSLMQQNIERYRTEVEQKAKWHWKRVRFNKRIKHLRKTFRRLSSSVLSGLHL